jgi:outer membrane protein assembly factor BamB
MRPNAVYAVSTDGMLQTLYVSNGADAEPPVKFLPPDSNVLGLIVVDNVVYAETSEGCGGRANAIWSLDLTSKQANVFESKTDATETWEWSHAGPAFGPDGTVYWTAGLAVAALEPKSLRPKKPITLANQEFTSSPVVFRFDDRILVAAATRDGAIHLLDGDTMTDISRQSGPVRSDFVPGALASWQDSSGMGWILAPAGNAIVAWKVVNQNGVAALQPGWVSREMVSPVTPIIVNGVVFALSSGEFRTSDKRVTAAERAQRSVAAILYALDAATGKELWNSANTITSFVHSGGLSAGDSQIYLSTYDGNLYAFGFPMEH